MESDVVEGDRSRTCTGDGRPCSDPLAAHRSPGSTSQRNADDDVDTGGAWVPRGASREGHEVGRSSRPPSEGARGRTDETVHAFRDEVSEGTLGR